MLQGRAARVEEMAVDVSVARDRDGRMICTLRPESPEALVTAADGSLAGMELTAALRAGLCES